MSTRIIGIRGTAETDVTGENRELREKGNKSKKEESKDRKTNLVVSASWKERDTGEIKEKVRLAE
jgi:hypothetical protein